jgi:hypothetical protein
MNQMRPNQNGSRRWRSCLAALVLALAGGLFVNAQPAKTSAPSMDFSAFRIISDGNIFNPNRFGRTPSNNQRPRTTRTVRRPGFSLAGLMNYNEGETPGIYAFFDGTSSDYRKVLTQDGMIAVFKIVAIGEDSVTLLRDTNQTVMKIGMQMRDEGGGHWVLTSEQASYGRNSVDEPARGFSNRRRGFGRNDFSVAAGGTPPDITDTNAVDDATAPDTMTDQADAQPGETNATETVTLPAGPASDALMRLMQLRQQEEQQTGGNRN